MDGSGFDVVVVGGGPCGSTVSTLIARQGHRVLLLERERFPRYQIATGDTDDHTPIRPHGLIQTPDGNHRRRPAGKTYMS